MDFVVYSSQTVAFLLVPGCYLPSAEAIRAYGSLRMLGTVAVAGAMGNTAWHRIVADIDEHSYAILSEAEAAQLFGRAYAGLVRQRERSDDLAEHSTPQP